MITRISHAWTGMPLRRRLVLGLLAVMAVTLALVGTAIFLSLRSYKFSQVDSGLSRGKVQLESDRDNGSYRQALQMWTTGGAQVYIVDANGAAYPVTNNLRFPGQYFDAESGLHYNNRRYYDPAGAYLDLRAIEQNRRQLIMRWVLPF